MAGRGSRRSAGAIGDAVDRMGHAVVGVRLVGQDPGTGCVRSVIVTRDGGVDPSSAFYVSDVRDWTRAYDRRDRDRGAELTTITGCVGYAEAEAGAVERYRGLLSGYTWYVPGTKDPVPGCRRAGGR